VRMPARVLPPALSALTCPSVYRRNNEDYLQDLGGAILNFSRVVPDGLLVRPHTRVPLEFVFIVSCWCI
jgi:hypothetical protein